MAQSIRQVDGPTSSEYRFCIAITVNGASRLATTVRAH
jgi:hypothetical protein